MSRPEARLAPWGIALSCVLALGAYASAFTAGGASVGSAVALALATALLIAAFVALGVGQGGFRRGPVLLAVATILLVVGGGISAALLIGAPEGPGAPLYGGLPAGAALVLYGVGLVPALVVPLLYAWGFDAEDDE